MKKWIRRRIINWVGHLLNPAAYTRLYKTGTMIQIGWHKWTAEDHERNQLHVEILRKYLEGM